MRGSLILLIIVLIVLASCANPLIPVINITSDDALVAQIQPVGEKSMDVKVVEDTIHTAVSDFTLTEESLTFTNRLRQVYYAPIDYLHTVESDNRAHFTINKGHYALLDKSANSFVVEYESIDTRKKEVIFKLNKGDEPRITVQYEEVLENVRSIIGVSDGKFSRGGIEVSRGYYGELEFEEMKEKNPKVTWDQFADSKTLGAGKLEINGLTFPFYVGYKAGNPLSMDLNGNGIIAQERIKVNTRLGKIYDEISGIQ